ncbi:MAG: low specificity L-threonine aldolase [Parvibaculaceae bacterium]
MNFASDNVYGVHPKIMAALAAANEGTHASYGYDTLTKEAEGKLQEVFETEARAFLVMTGTAANGLALSSITPSYGAVLTHAEAHAAIDECNAPELFTGGAKIIGLKGENGKISPAEIEKVLKSFIRGEHDPKPAAVSITNATELGTTYAPHEIAAISGILRPRGMRLHMDGARFANALVGRGVTPAEMTWKAGVDVLSFGATKNGALILEAVIFFDPKLAEDFIYRRMRGGQLLSKTRYLAAQMLAYLEDGLWLENARRANGLAKRLRESIDGLSHARIAVPVEANEVFVSMPATLHEKLLAAGVRCHEWVSDSIGEEGLKADNVLARFVLSWATPEEDVARVADLIRAG